MPRRRRSRSRFYETFRAPYGFYTPSQPRAVKGGIRARSQRGAFGTSWWARRWIEVLEGFELGARLTRGRRYARSGQVLDIEIAPGRVAARVQGSRATPYRVEIELAPLSPAAWKRVAAQLACEAAFSARLLAGEMPDGIEHAFAATGVSLFPERSRDPATQCSCPDWSNPCKHIAAVYYLLGEEFDRDPFLIFQLRGIARRNLAALLTGGSKATMRTRPTAKPRKRIRRVRAVAHTEAPSEPLPADPATFWGEAAPSAAVPLPPLVHTGAIAALPRRLGPFPFWRGARDFGDTLDGIYVGAASAALDRLAEAAP